MDVKQINAFPIKGAQLGLTKREYFAAMAMIGMVKASVTGEVDDFGPKNMATYAVDVADALIAALNR